MATVVTNIALVLDGWQTAITAAHIGGNTLEIVYDETLEYSDMMRSFRSKNKRLAQTGKDAKRLLAYNREVLQVLPHGAGRRRQQVIDLLSSPVNNADIYKAVHGLLPVRFVFTTPDAREMESFEVGYMAGQGIRTVKKITSTFPGLGEGGNEPLDHFIHWEELESKEITVEESFHKIVTGSLRIEGWFIVLRTEDSPAQLIDQINTLIQNEQLAVFDSDTIVPEVST